MAQTRKIGKHATTVATMDVTTRVTYHDTVVVEFNEKAIKLDTGGWFTVTTKLRMNQTSNEYGLGYTVYQDKKKWFVEFEGSIIPFIGNVVILNRRPGS